MRKLIFPLTIVATIIPAAASAQTSGTASAATTAQATANSTVDPTAEARITIAIERAVTAGIPVQLLETKVAEGRAKGVSLTRVAAVVEKRAEVLARVQNVLATDAGNRSDVVAAGELTAAADAHEGGISLENIAKLTASAGNDRAAALTVLADLIASGRAPEHALLRVQNALRAGGNALAEVGRTTGATIRATTPAVNAGANGSAAADAGKNKGPVRANAAGTVRIGG